MTTSSEPTEGILKRISKKFAPIAVIDPADAALQPDAVDVAVPMSPAEISRAEAERDRLIADTLRGYSPPPVSAPAPRAKTGVLARHVEASEIEASRDAIVALHREHEFTTQTADLAFKNKLADLLDQQAALEATVAHQIDAAVSGQLKDVLAKRSSAAPGIETKIADARQDAGAARQEALWQRASFALDKAEQTRQLLKAFDAEYGADLDELRGVSRVQWMIGTPATSPGAHRAAALYTQLENGLDAIRVQRDALVSMLRTDNARVHESEVADGFEFEINALVKRAAQGWSPEEERSFVWATTRLALATPDSVATLQQLVRGVIHAASALTEMKSIANTGWTRTIVPLPEPTMEQKIRWGQAPMMADANWSPFGPKEA